MTPARALARAAGANRLPQAVLNANASRQGGPLINAAGEDGTLFVFTLTEEQVGDVQEGFKI